MNTNPVAWFEIYVQDMQCAKKFYETVLQHKLERLDNPMVELWAFPMSMEKSGASGALVKMAGFPLGRQQHPGLFQLRRLRGGRAHPEGKDVHRSLRLHRPCV